MCSTADRSEMIALEGLIEVILDLDEYFRTNGREDLKKSEAFQLVAKNQMKCLIGLLVKNAAFLGQGEQDQLREMLRPDQETRGEILLILG